jgi:serine/threonine protein kinase
MDKTIQTTVKELMQINHIEKIALKDLTLKKKIGEGGQAKVYRASYENETVAVKVIVEPDFKCLAHEIIIISNLQHENIPRFYGIVLEEKVLSLVFQYVKGKTLDEFKNEITDEIKYQIIKQTAFVLEYMHSQKFIHRDLKPENLMYDPDLGKLYLIDFGISKVLTNEGISTRAKGTPHYLAPECLIVENINEEDQIISNIGPKVDSWAFGCIVSWLFSGILPWCNKYKNNDSVLQAVLMKKKPFPIPENITDEKIVKLISMCTQISLDERWDMTQVKEYIETVFA